ncbi:acetylxylan esterase, partial [Candidatus Poribacteria bacterium]|nr:acetylxylan esterase [Candidatus Poribacteria bacterium]
GERHINYHGNSGCMVGWARLNHMGQDLTGLRIFDLMAGINLLNQLPEVDSARIGCVGLSGGCWLTQVLAAIDPRIQAVILSGFFTTFVQTIWHGHCVCHHPHGIGLVCDLPDYQH